LASELRKSSVDFSVNKFELGFSTVNLELAKKTAQESHMLLGLKVNDSVVSLRSSHHKSQSNILLGTDKRYLSYADAITSSQDGFKLNSARENREKSPNEIVRVSI
jgi:hypothetical protein